MSDPHNRNVALTWGTRAMRVFPCESGGPGAKTPLIRDNLRAATSDPEQIRAWWDRWPNAVPGGVMGEGIVILDVDRHADGDDGFTTLAALEADGFRVPEGAMRVATPNNGMHFYMKSDRPVRTRNGLKPGIDLRGVDCYCILAGSRMADGREYRILDAGGALAAAA